MLPLSSVKLRIDCLPRSLIQNWLRRRQLFYSSPRVRRYQNTSLGFDKHKCGDFFLFISNGGDVKAFLCWLLKVSTVKEFVKVHETEVDQTYALEVCYSWVAEWSPTDPDDDEVWDSSRWKWKKAASRLHWKWGWPHSYTPWQVPGKRRKFPYCYSRLFLRKRVTFYSKRNAFFLGLREVLV